MDISPAKLLVFWLCSMSASIINGDVVIPSSFMTLDPYTEAQHHHETVAQGHYKPQVLPQVSHDPPLTYHVVPGNPYELLHQINQQSLHQLDHQPHYQQTHHQPQYNQHQKPFHKPHAQKLYKPHAIKLPVTPHIAHDKHFISHNAHTQHLTYTPPKIQKLIKKTPLDFPKKGYISHKLAPARDDYARSLYFPSSGYNIDSYFHHFPAFGYFNYEPKNKLHLLENHRRRRMLDFNNIESSEGLHDSFFIPNSQINFEDSKLTQKRMPRSSTNDNLTSKKVQEFKDSPSVMNILSRVPRTSSIFPNAPQLPRLLKPRSIHDKQNTWLNQ